MAFEIVIPLEFLDPSVGKALSQVPAGWATFTREDNPNGTVEYALRCETFGDLGSFVLKKSDNPKYTLLSIEGPREKPQALTSEELRNLPIAPGSGQVFQDLYTRDRESADQAEETDRQKSAYFEDVIQLFYEMLYAVLRESAYSDGAETFYRGVQVRRADRMGATKAPPLGRSRKRSQVDGNSESERMAKLDAARKRAVLVDTGTSRYYDPPMPPTPEERAWISPQDRQLDEMGDPMAAVVNAVSEICQQQNWHRQITNSNSREYREITAAKFSEVHPTGHPKQGSERGRVRIIYNASLPSPDSLTVEPGQYGAWSGVDRLAIDMFAKTVRSKLSEVIQSMPGRPSNKRGKRSRYSQAEKDENVKAWEATNKDADSQILSDFLTEHFGDDEETFKPNVAESTFYTWRDDFFKRNPGWGPTKEARKHRRKK